ncbi:MAG: DNA repair protein RecO [Alphaproteobacteria bacterium]
MEWQDEGILLKAEKLGERKAVATFFTREHGNHAGLIQNITAKNNIGWLQPGNSLQIQWFARLEDQLGVFSWQALGNHVADFIFSPLKLLLLQSTLGLIGLLLPDRLPYPDLYAKTLNLLAGDAAKGQSEPILLQNYIFWELYFLAAIGYGLDLSVCALTGSREQLAYVSPKTGRAASLAAGLPYAGRLLALPQFLLSNFLLGDDQHQAGEISQQELQQGLALTGYFLEKLLKEQKNTLLPPARQRLSSLLLASE